MKIWGELVFDPGTQVLRSVVGAFCSLPEPLRATRHCLGEDEVAQPIEDVAAFLGSLSSDRLGPILRAKEARYTVSALGEDKRVECMCQFNARAMPRVRDFMERMAAIGPVFGFASAWDEHAHRNRIDVSLRPYREQSFLGNDLSKCVPGLYWLTLLPEDLAEWHGVPLSEVRQAALEDVDLGGGQRLFRFHDDPAKWRERADEIDAVCAAVPGIFNIADVRARLVGVTEEREYKAIVDPWRRTGWTPPPRRPATIPA